MDPECPVYPQRHWEKVIASKMVSTTSSFATTKGGDAVAGDAVDETPKPVTPPKGCPNVVALCG